jgi:hypothetical protein
MADEDSNQPEQDIHGREMNGNLIQLISHPISAIDPQQLGSKTR